MSIAADRKQSTRLSGRQWLTLVVLTVSTFMVLLDANVVNIALQG